MRSFLLTDDSFAIFADPLMNLRPGRLFFHSHRIDGCCLIGYGGSILIFHGETFFRTDLNAEIADAALETIDLPFFAVLGDRNGIRWAAPAAHSAEDARVDIHLHVSPRQRREPALLFWIHERSRAAEQVLGDGFGHRK